MKDIFFKTIMLKGESGGTIQKIEKTSSSGLVDTYTIYYNDGETSTFEVENGSSIASIVKTATSGLQDTYTITLTNGETSTFTVMNGEDAPSYELPAGSVIYFDSSDAIPEGYEASTNPDADELYLLENGKADKVDLSIGSILETSLSDLEDTLLGICGNMEDSEVRIYQLNPNFSSPNFFAGAIQIAIITRRESGVYRIALPNICGDMYYYSNSWHYTKATMSSVTP